MSDASRVLVQLLAVVRGVVDAGRVLRLVPLSYDFPAIGPMALADRLKGQGYRHSSHYVTVFLSMLASDDTVIHGRLERDFRDDAAL